MSSLLITILFGTISVLLGAAGRSLVGSGHLSRWATYPPIALIVVALQLVSIHQGLDILTVACMGWAVLVVSLTLGMGYTQWEDRKHMMLRYGVPSLLLVMPWLVQGQWGALIYPMIAALMGWSYPIRQKLFDLVGCQEKSIPLLGKDFHWNSGSVMEMFLGGSLLGGLYFL